MDIELVYRDKTVVRAKSLDELTFTPDDIVHIQFINYTQNDIREIEKRFDLNTSILHSGDDIEISSHYLENEKQIAINFSVPYFTADGRITEELVYNILKDNAVFSFIAVDFEAFIPEKQRQSYVEKFNNFRFPTDSYLLIVVGFFSDYFADLTEIVSKKIKVQYSEVLKGNKLSEEGLDKITIFSFNNLIVKESVNEYRRVLHLLRKSSKLSSDTKEALYSELNDLVVINEYIQNNFERIDDLKENISSKIELEQNRIFKILTIVTMCIALPTLVAGIYGMNFKYIPELEWKWGYVFALILIILSFSLPLIWFKRKKWL
jgi:magnesium transporter